MILVLIAVGLNHVEQKDGQAKKFPAEDLFIKALFLTLPASEEMMNIEHLLRFRDSWSRHAKVSFFVNYLIISGSISNLLKY